MPVQDSKSPVSYPLMVAAVAHYMGVSMSILHQSIKHPLDTIHCLKHVRLCISYRLQVSESNPSSTSAALVHMTMHTTKTHIYLVHISLLLLILGNPFNTLITVIIRKITTKGESSFVHLSMVKCPFH